MPLLFIPAIQQITHRVGLSIAALPGLDVSQGEAHILAHLADHGESTIAELHRSPKLAAPTLLVVGETVRFADPVVLAQQFSVPAVAANAPN